MLKQAMAVAMMMCAVSAAQLVQAAENNPLDPSYKANMTQPGVQFIENRLRLRLTQLFARFSIEGFTVSLNGILFCDAFQRLRRNRAFIGSMQVKEFAPCVSEAA